MALDTILELETSVRHMLSHLTTEVAAYDTVAILSSMAGTTFSLVANYLK